MTQTYSQIHSTSHSPPVLEGYAPQNDTMLIRVGSEFAYSSRGQTPALLQVESRQDTNARIVRETWTTTPEISSHTYLDLYSNRNRRLILPDGQSTFRYDALVEISSYPDIQVPTATQGLVQDLPDETLHFTLASRYCQSDLISDDAWKLFADAPLGWGRVQAVCDWAHDNVAYVSGCSTPETTAMDVYNLRQGICRDFAHIGVTLCRALNIPARYCFGYMPDIGVIVPPVAMDFHAWFEVFLEGRWYAFDARHNKPRIGRVPIARGRDAVDCAMVTTYGNCTLERMTVWADAATPDDLAHFEYSK